MPNRRRSAACSLTAALVAVGLCACFGAVLAVAASVPSLGEPATGLVWTERASLALYLLLHRPDLDSAAGPEQRAVSLEVQPGQDASDVAAELARLGVVRNPTLFARYLHYRGLDTGIEAGSYQVSGALDLRDLADLLQRAGASRFTLIVPEGWRREQVAEAVGKLGLAFGAADFLTATRSVLPGTFGAPPGTTDAEGFLFPDTYRLDPRMTADEVVHLMVANFEDRVGRDLLDGFEARGLSPYEAVTLASIVEHEAALPTERPLIASVFLNRLALGLPLQADPTVQYALGRQADGTWWKAPLTEADLRTDSPYNTYLYRGLPPGPIGNPGLASLQSVASPAQTTFLFFRAACDGSGAHLFATTFEQHVRNACP